MADVHHARCQFVLQYLTAEEADEILGRVAIVSMEGILRVPGDVRRTEDIRQRPEHVLSRKWLGIENIQAGDQFSCLQSIYQGGLIEDFPTRTVDQDLALSKARQFLCSDESLRLWCQRDLYNKDVGVVENGPQFRTPDSVTGCDIIR